MYLVGGSIPEKSGDDIYNTSLAFDNHGKLLAVHRKVHLFDIDVPGKIRFQESEVLSSGQTFQIRCMIHTDRQASLNLTHHTEDWDSVYVTMFGSLRWR